MFQFVGYNFLADGDALNNAPAEVENITKTRLSNAIFDHFNVTRNIDTPFSAQIPEIWDYDTVLNANFNGNLSAGNIEAVLDQITAVKIKRRIKGQFDWITIKEIKVDSVDDLTFVIEDKLNANDTEYEYAFVPVLNETEGNYTVASIFSKFKGIFIGDAENIFRFLYEVNYSANGVTQKVGTFEPLGRQYPILIANGNLNYQTGSVSGLVLNDDYEKTRRLDRKGAVVRKDKLLKFLTNHKAKVLKDWNSNLWLVSITGNPQVGYKNGSGMGMPNVTFGWTEIGDASNQQDLYNNGLVDTPN